MFKSFKPFKPFKQSEAFQSFNRFAVFPLVLPRGRGGENSKLLLFVCFVVKKSP